MCDRYLMYVSGREYNDNACQANAVGYGNRCSTLNNNKKKKPSMLQLRFFFLNTPFLTSFIDRGSGELKAEV